MSCVIMKICSPVLGSDYCAGFVDGFGVWHNGFPCPGTPPSSPAFCCGTAQHQYCCRGLPLEQLTTLRSVSVLLMELINLMELLINFIGFILKLWIALKSPRRTKHVCNLR